MSYSEIQKLIEERRSELIELWLEEHLAVAPLQSDERLIREVHGRSAAFLEVLSHALASKNPDNWDDFEHREVLHIVTLMVHSLAEGSASAGAVASLVPSVGRAMERLGASRVASGLSALSAVATEAYSEVCLGKLMKEQMVSLSESMPVLKLEEGVVLVAAMGRPDEEAARRVVNRTVKALMKVTTRPTLILDLSHLDTELESSVLSAFLQLSSEARALGGSLHVVVGPDKRNEVEGTVPKHQVWSTLEEALSGRRGLLRKLGRAFKG